MHLLLFYKADVPDMGDEKSYVEKAGRLYLVGHKRMLSWLELSCLLGANIVSNAEK